MSRKTKQLLLTTAFMGATIFSTCSHAMLFGSQPNELGPIVNAAPYYGDIVLEPTKSQDNKNSYPDDSFYDEDEEFNLNKCEINSSCDYNEFDPFTLDSNALDLDNGVELNSEYSSLYFKLKNKAKVLGEKDKILTQQIDKYVLQYKYLKQWIKEAKELRIKTFNALSDYKIARQANKISQFLTGQSLEVPQKTLAKLYNTWRKKKQQLSSWYNKHDWSFEQSLANANINKRRTEEETAEIMMNRIFKLANELVKQRKAIESEISQINTELKSIEQEL